jgi:tungstate transport system ATP-binding protein
VVNTSPRGADTQRPFIIKDIFPMSVENLTFVSEGKEILRGITFHLDSNGRTFIVGPNGAGKSFLLRLCHGLLQPTEGKIVWANDSSNWPRNQQAMVFQQPMMLRRSVLANIQYALSVRGVHGSEQRQRARSVIENTGLSQLAHKNARMLSIGEQQRLALARAWVVRPRILFLDEPTAHLDPSATRMLEEIIVRITESDTKIIMSSHDMSQVRRLSDDVLFLHLGRLMEHVPTKQFFSQPQTREGQMFIAGDLLW